MKNATQPLPALDMAKVIQAANKPAAPKRHGKPVLDEAKVQAAVARYQPKPHVPQAPISHAGRIPEDVARRGYFSRLPVRACCNIHSSDFS